MTKKVKIVSILIGVLIMITAFVFLLKSKFLFLAIGIAVIIIALPFLLSFLAKESRNKEKEELFLEFARNLVEAVKSGTPLSKAIVMVGNKEYGPLTEHTKKLASQIELGISVRQAFQNFAQEVDNNIVSRSIALILQADSSGGEISSILDAVVVSITQIEEIKKERSSGVYSLIIQGYIIFLIFLVVMVFVQVKFMPLIFNSFSTDLSGTATVAKSETSSILDRAFFILILVQAFFTGLVTGKLGEGKVKAGIKHSAILLIIAFLFLAVSKILT